MLPALDTKETEYFENRVILAKDSEKINLSVKTIANALVG